MAKYYAGQRVLINDREIGVVCSQFDFVQREGHIWVKDSRGVPHCYAEHNIKPLPNGQL